MVSSVTGQTPVCLSVCPKHAYNIYICIYVKHLNATVDEHTWHAWNSTQIKPSVKFLIFVESIQAMIIEAHKALSK